MDILGLCLYWDYIQVSRFGVDLPRFVFANESSPKLVLTNKTNRGIMRQYQLFRQG